MTEAVEELKETEMGRVIVKAKLTNYEDIIRSETGAIPPDQIRTVETDGLVDTGATMLVLPGEVAKQLGLSIARYIEVRYADGRKEKRGIARGVIVEIQGREAEVEAVVEAPGTKLLIGQVPLEVMDLTVDPKAGTVGPRPESPDAPLIEIY
jgi:clan AA aspartic protease